MTNVDPLPFRIKVPGYDAFDAQGIVSITIKLEGLLSVSDNAITLEWKATRQIDSVSLSGVTDEVDESPVGRCEIPVDLILEARLRGGWWSPRLELRARRLDAFENIPTAQSGIAKLRIRRLDRDRARAVCAAIEETRREHQAE
jgi:hypothetical protein